MLPCSACRRIRAFWRVSSGTLNYVPLPQPRTSALPWLKRGFRVNLTLTEPAGSTQLMEYQRHANHTHDDVPAVGDGEYSCRPGHIPCSVQEDRDQKGEEDRRCH